MKKKPKPRKPKPYLWLLLLALLIPLSAHAETPQVNIPPQLRQKNWTVNRSGSCVHASAVTLWRWQGQYKWANYWKSKYGSGEWAERFHERCDREGVTYADTYGEDDVSFIEWACRTRRGCLIGIDNAALFGGDGGGHALCVVHIDAKCVGVLNNNGKYKIQYFERAGFIKAWKAHGSWAWSPISTPPAPPLPKASRQNL